MAFVSVDEMAQWSDDFADLQARALKAERERDEARVTLREARTLLYEEFPLPEDVARVVAKIDDLCPLKGGA